MWGDHIDSQRPRSFVSALWSIAVAESAKNQLLRHFRRRSIFISSSQFGQTGQNGPAECFLKVRLPQWVSFRDIGKRLTRFATSRPCPTFAGSSNVRSVGAPNEAAVLYEPPPERESLAVMEME